MEGRKQAAGGQHEGAAGQDGALVVDPVQVAAGHVGHADGAGRAVQELVPVSAGETRNQKTGPTHLVFVATIGLSATLAPLPGGA